MLIPAQSVLLIGCNEVIALLAVDCVDRRIRRFERLSHCGDLDPVQQANDEHIF